MENNSFLTSKLIENINKQLIEIKRNSKETQTLDGIQCLMDYLKNYYVASPGDKETLAENIENSMKEARRNNSDMETVLYIIHGDLINSRISLEKATLLYQQYLNISIFNKETP